MKLSAIMQVYNEERCLPYSLGSILPYIDECIILDGSEQGLSTDGSFAIIDRFIAIYPGLITYVSGDYRRDDGAWDDTKQTNEGFARVTGDFVMRTHADIVYERASMVMLRDIVELFPHKRYFYCPLLEFFWDTDHIMLPSVLLPESSLLRPMCGDVAVLSMSTDPHFEDLGTYRRSSLCATIDWNSDPIFMPHVRRFHYSHVKPFKDEVEKIVRYIKRGDYEAQGMELQQAGEKAIWDWAIEHVESYGDHPNLREYAGVYPEEAEPLRSMKTLDGYSEFIDEYRR